MLYGKNHFGAKQPEKDIVESDDIYQDVDFEQLRGADNLEAEFSNDLTTISSIQKM